MATQTTPTAKAPNDPSNKYNTATGQLNTNYSGGSSAPATAPVKNTWEQTIAPASMPGYSGLGRRVANPDYIPGSVNPADVQAQPTGGATQPKDPILPNPMAMPQAPVTPGATPNANPLAPDANGNYTIDLAKIPQGAERKISPYKIGFDQTTASGAGIPKTAGEAAGTIRNTLPSAQDEVSPLTGIVDTDSTFDSIFTQYDKFFSPMKQKQSLLDEYKSLESTLGITSMNAELLNSKRIIEGTEDDIRSEVQAVNGFATESQVLALSNARNKSLIKNYNYLLEARDSAKTQLSTMMNLSIKDREIAQSEFDTKMNFGFKVAEFKQKAIDNSREVYNNQIKLMGADGLYNSLVATGDPSTISVVEKTMGYTPGSLKIAAEQATKDRANKATMDSLDIKYKKASIDNIYSQINDRNNPDTGGITTLNGKPQNASQSAANSYANRLVESSQVIDNLGSKFTGKLSQLPAFNFMKSSDRQVYEQAQKNFVTAVLRRESGASIADTEFDTAKDIYFPKRGDSPEVVAQKAATRQTVINNFFNEANVPNPNNSIKLPNGDTIIITD